MAAHPRTPILIAVGQAVDHWDGADPSAAPSPISMCVQAARAALDDSGAVEPVGAAIDCLAVVRSNLDSIAGAKHPFGRCANPPATIAHALGLAPETCIYSQVGGDQPQALVNEFAEAIFEGRAGTVLLTGGEAIGAMKTARKKRLKLDWSQSASGAMTDRGLGEALLSDYEIANGLGFPVQTYPLFEQALRARLGLSREAHRALAAQLLAPFSEIAAANRYAQFPKALTQDFLAAQSRENYALSDPHLKWHAAQDSVNQGAALILTSVEKARALGVDPAKWVYLQGYAQTRDKTPSLRQDLSRSKAMELALAGALDSAKLQPSDIAHFDLYSCFPCAVLIAAEALGLDWRKTVPTVTGGLPFFGGAGNNYAMHAIASMAETLRAQPQDYGLVLANGGYLSKEAVGAYSCVPAKDWRPVSSASLQAALDSAPEPVLLSGGVEAVIESYAVTYVKDQPQRGYVCARTPQGRILARARNGHRATLAALAQADPLGRAIRIEHEDGVNYFCPAGALGAPKTDAFMERAFHYVQIERRGHVLEVTLNRPESLNALFGPAHYELHEIWDAFEKDDDLWVAILTGAGERAFCSGNDLKATAKGGDISTPRSGFGGLCERFDREKPIIAAINGAAMGGGMEIVLACDLAIAEDHAKLALPEVKVGLFAAAGGVHRLTRQIGRKAAMELILTGRHIGAEEALRLGVVNAVAPKGGGLEAARAMADLIVANSPTAVRASKAAMNKLEDIESLREAIEANGALFGALMRTHDFKEGVAAFAEKRKPTWTNR